MGAVSRSGWAAWNTKMKYSIHAFETMAINLKLVALDELAERDTFSASSDGSRLS